ncbi:IS66 family transposase [Ensifer canadensis]|nr:transposase [Ensifer canadensis]
MSYAITRWNSLRRFLAHGTLEIDNAAAERAILSGLTN